MIVLFGAEKGGVGKTTAAVQMARERAAAGRDVLLIECDKQLSAAKWAKTRNDEKVRPSVPCVSLFGDDVAEQVRGLAGRYEDIVIDTPGHDSVEMRSAMMVADKLITPIRTSQFDIDTLMTMNKLVRDVRASLNPAIKAYILINGASTNVRSKREQGVREMLEQLANYNGVLDSRLCHRQAFELVAEQGRAVTEFSGDRKAADEICALATEVWA